jgi:Short C-terminal domain
MRRRGRPGLLGTIGRTAVIAGTASATANAVNRSAHNRAVTEQQAAAFRADQAAQAAPQQAPPPQQAAAPSGGTDLVSQLTDLARLRDAGALSPQEFDAAKAKLLGS